MRLSFGSILSNLFELQGIMLSPISHETSPGCGGTVCGATSHSPWVCPFLYADQTIRIFIARASQVQINPTIVDIGRESKSFTVRFKFEVPMV